MYCKLPWTYLLDSLGRRHRAWRLVFVFYLSVSIIWPNWRRKVIGRFSRLAKTADGSPSNVFLPNYQVTFPCGLSLLIYLREHPLNSYALSGRGFRKECCCIWRGNEVLFYFICHFFRYACYCNVIRRKLTPILKFSKFLENGKFHCSSHLDMWTKFRSIF